MAAEGVDQIPVEAPQALPVRRGRRQEQAHLVLLPLRVPRILQVRLLVLLAGVRTKQKALVQTKEQLGFAGCSFFWCLFS